MLTKRQLISKLNLSKIKYELTEHDPLFTVKDSVEKRGTISGSHSKNLFLKNKKNEFFLISCEENDNVDLKKLSKQLNLGNVSFAKEEYLFSLLGIMPGSVSPFALMNDTQNAISFFLEKKLYDSKFLNFHPLVNTLTITIETSEFIKFMIENNKKIHIFSLTDGVIINTHGK